MSQKITWLKADEIFPEVQKHCLIVNSVLDVGCGIRPQRLTDTFIHICADAHKQYLDVLQKENSRKLTFKDKIKFFYLNITTATIISKFPRKSVNSVFLLDVIEHLEKDHAFNLIKSFEEIANNQIVLFTPLGFVKQEHPDGKDAWGLDGGKWQEHKSGWLPEEFDDSWEIFACKDFHPTNNVGKEHSTPVGAFFAVKTLTKDIDLVFKKNILNKMIVWLKFYLKVKNFKNSL